MSISTVKTALVSIAAKIAGAQRDSDRAKALMLSARNALNSIPTDFAAEIAEINAYTPTGAFQTLAQDEKAKLQTEFGALKSTLEGYLTSLGVSYT